MEKNTKITDDFVWSHKKKKVNKTLWAFPVEDQCSKIVRIIEPVNIACNLQKINAEIQTLDKFINIPEYVTLDFFDKFFNKSIIFQRYFFYTDSFLLENIKKYSNSKIIYDTDDLITHIPEHSPFCISPPPPPQ